MWKHNEDSSDAIITAKKHVISSHRSEKGVVLPSKAVIFCLGSAMKYLKNHYKTKVIMESIPKFIGDSECLIIEEYSNVCFVHGGYGSPAVVDTVETLIELGVKEIILIGMCGGFSSKVNVGDVIIPNKILSEEGTSLHYYEDITFVNQSEILVSKGLRYFSQYFNTYKFNTVTTDAIYRQTFFKEDYWRKMDCVGVDMEASALISVSNYYNIEPNVILLVSDKHPVKKEDKNWVWGNPNFKSIKDKFINSSIKYAINNEQY